MLELNESATLDESNQLQYLIENMRTFVSAIRSCPLKPHAIFLGYNTLSRSHTKYPLSTTSLDTKRVRLLHKTIIPMLLTRMWCIRNIPLTLAFSSNILGGLPIMHTMTTQTSGKVYVSLKHMRSNTNRKEISNNDKLGSTNCGDKKHPRRN